MGPWRGTEKYTTFQKKRDTPMKKMSRLLSVLLVVLTMVMLLDVLPGTVFAASVKAPVVTIANDAETGKPVLTWDAVKGAAKYEVYRATSSGGTYSRRTTTSKTTFTNTNAEAGKTYYYKVRAIAKDGTYANSKVVSTTCDLACPVVTATNTASTGYPKLTWEAVEGAVSYKVYRAASKTGTYSLAKTTTGTTYTNSTAKVGKTYYYKVMAVAEKSAANSAYSAILSRTCDLPQPVVTASNVTATGYPKLTWEAVEGAVSYKVYRSTAKDGTYSLTKTTTSTSYTNTSAKPGNVYYYKVVAVAEDGTTSAPSNIVGRTCDLPQPVVTASNVAKSGKVKLTWEPVEGAVEYKVYRSTSKDGTYSLTKTLTNTTYTNTNAVAGTKYYYKVVAVAEKSAANSAGTQVSRTCDLPQVQPSVSLNAKGKPNVTWKAVDGAVSYKVYRATAKDGSYSLTKTLTSTNYVNTSAVSGKTYYYKVVAVCSNTDANSAASSIVSITAK